MISAYNPAYNPYNPVARAVRSGGTLHMTVLAHSNCEGREESFLFSVLLKHLTGDARPKFALSRLKCMNNERAPRKPDDGRL